ncbi:putative killer cell immunoglobulin-like receptor-like protein KIR3DX1 isoform X1 [Papio anubis]|uniref:putative killer cell immunoglobulin-like receptor-like protein KIR3DX1 isoform X1 n=1 Tax=Papio anubis TaxID=9555 RepID=UPI0012AE6D01|nr:putative killer cell immunoglobulin-like receptor-like protein KIR3DX1 isoform X1 [Papio anubis]
MAPKLITLLCLGICLPTRICTHTGGYDKFSLSAWPSPVVPLGGRVTLSCHSHLQFVIFTIFKRSGTRDHVLHTGLSNNITIGPVTPGHAGTYRCAGSYNHTTIRSAHSKSLKIVVTGLFTKPSISAHPSSLVHAGARVSLRCHSELTFDEFILYKEGNTQHSQQYGKMIQAGHHFSKAVFSMGPITPAHAGAYRCCGSFNRSRYMWSAPSNPLDIVITGKYKKPSLITRENAMAGPGDTVTLFCSSKIPFDKYHLSKKQEAHGHWLSGGQSHSGIFQVDLPLCLVSPTSVGSYRCYGAFNESPYEWSAPSDPLHVPVTGIPESTCLTPMESTPETGSLVSRKPKGSISAEHQCQCLSGKGGAEMHPSGNVSPLGIYPVSASNGGHCVEETKKVLSQFSGTPCSEPGPVIFQNIF